MDHSELKYSWQECCIDPPTEVNDDNGDDQWSLVMIQCHDHGHTPGYPLTSLCQHWCWHIIVITMLPSMCSLHVYKLLVTTHHHSWQFCQFPQIRQMRANCLDSVEKRAGRDYVIVWSHCLCVVAHLANIVIKYSVITHLRPHGQQQVFINTQLLFSLPCFDSHHQGTPRLNFWLVLTYLYF